MELTVADETRLAELAALLRSAKGEIRFDIRHQTWAYLDPIERPNYLAELAVWSKADGFEGDLTVAELEERWREERAE